MQIIFLIAGFFVGLLLAWVILSNRFSGKLAAVQIQLSESDKERGILLDRDRQNIERTRLLEDKLEEARKQLSSLNGEFVQQQTLNESLREKLALQKSELEEIQSRMKTEFANLANSILEEKSKKFTEQNRDNLDVILNPLKEKIREFELKVDTAYKTESAERNSLKGEIKNLIELNTKISAEANNLARALKGDTKKQGNWGEVILEKILERSGLTRGVEYETQFSTSNDDGRRLQPDVVINLPDKKHLIIDSKVSLLAYDAMVNAADDVERELKLREHIASVRNHIKLLSEKNYQGLGDFTSPDFVLMFMPIESSFGIAVQADNELFNYAWERKIVMVSPSTLLATLRTIDSIWKQERQSRNAQEIAQKAGQLYDKFKNFTDDLIDVGKRMDAAKVSYTDAMNKLSSGSGNIVRRVEELRKLGAKVTKELPAVLVERAEENQES